MEFLRLQDDNQDVLANANASDKAHREWQFKERQRLAGTPDPQVIDFPGEDEDVRTYRIDSDDRVVHNHYYPGSQPAEAPSTDNKDGTPLAPAAGLSKLLPWIAAGSLLLGGTGVGLGVMALLKKAPVVQPSKDTDTDTAIELIPNK